jgi:hypothetical protein
MTDMSWDPAPTRKDDLERRPATERAAARRDVRESHALHDVACSCAVEARPRQAKLSSTATRKGGEAPRVAVVLARAPVTRDDRVCSQSRSNADGCRDRTTPPPPQSARPRLADQRLELVEARRFGRGDESHRSRNPI